MLGCECRFGLPNDSTLRRSKYEQNDECMVFSDYLSFSVPLWFSCYLGHGGGIKRTDSLHKWKSYCPLVGMVKGNKEDTAFVLPSFHTATVNLAWDSLRRKMVWSFIFRNFQGMAKKQYCSPNLLPKTKCKSSFAVLLPHPVPKRTDRLHWQYSETC